MKHRFPLATATALAIAATVPCAAGAQELTLTAQAVAAHAEFLTQAPPPPVQGVLCLVDSGVDVNPDTEPILVGRESVFGGTLDDMTSYHHGTYVSMVAGAAANGWGMVGAWPQLRVLSVRVMPEGSDHLSGEAVRDGILRCRQASLAEGSAVRVIELALGGPASGRAAAELAMMAEAVARARSDGIIVISASGNDGGSVNAPASLPGVIAVGASGTDGSLCSFSSRGPELDVVALGCGMDVAALPTGAPGTGQSTSLASAFVAGVVTALRSYKPELTGPQAEALLADTSAAEAGGVPRLDASALFRAAGLSSLVEAYPPPAPTPMNPASAAPRCDPATRVCSRPRVRGVTRRGRRVIIRLARLPKGVRAAVRIGGRLRVQTRKRVIRLRAARKQLITIRFIAPGLAPSEPIVIRGTRVRP